MSNIVLNSKTYTGIGFDANGVSQWVEQSGGIPSSFSKLTGKVNLGSGKSGSTVKWKFAVPIVAASDSSCACEGDVLRTYYVRIEVDEPAGSQSAERIDVRARIASLIGVTQFVDSIEDLTQPT